MGRLSLWRLVHEKPLRAIAILGSLFLIMWPSFASVVSFLEAKTPSQFAEDGYRIPPDWSAGVANHGRYREWWTIADHPVLFVASVVGLVGGLLVFATLLNRERSRQAATLPWETAKSTQDARLESGHPI